MNLRLPGTRAHAPEVKIESNSQDDIVQDHDTVRDVDEPQGGGEEMMEPVGPAYNPTENDVALTPPVVPVAPTYNRVIPGDQAVRSKDQRMTLFLTPNKDQTNILISHRQQYKLWPNVASKNMAKQLSTKYFPYTM